MVIDKNNSWALKDPEIDKKYPSLERLGNR